MSGIDSSVLADCNTDSHATGHVGEFGDWRVARFDLSNEILFRDLAVNLR